MELTSRPMVLVCALIIGSITEQAGLPQASSWSDLAMNTPVLENFHSMDVNGYPTT